MWSEVGKGFSQTFAPKRTLDVDTLYQQYQKYREEALQVPKDINTSQLTDDLLVAVAGDDVATNNAHREEVLKSLIDFREKYVRCFAPDDGTPVNTLYKSGGACTKAWQQSYAFSSSPATLKMVGPGDLGLQMASYDLFPGEPCEVFGASGDPKKLPAYTAKMEQRWEELLECLEKNKGIMTAQVVFDGRLLRARMATEQWLQRTTCEDESKQVEWSTTYPWSTGKP